jgi:hypothetical protein
MSTMVNMLGSLDVDIILDEGPDTVNLMEDTFEALVGLAKAGAPVPPAVLIELATLDGATKKRILTMLQQAAQPNPLAQKAQELELADRAAKIAETKSKTVKNIASAHADMQPEPVPAAPQQQHRPPSESINFKDIPPEAQSQMLAQVGIVIHPDILAAHAERQQAEKVNNAARLEAVKAAVRPPAQPRAS